MHEPQGRVSSCLAIHSGMPQAALLIAHSSMPQQAPVAGSAPCRSLSEMLSGPSDRLCCAPRRSLPRGFPRAPADAGSSAIALASHACLSAARATVVAEKRQWAGLSRALHAVAPQQGTCIDSATHAVPADATQQRTRCLQWPFAAAQATSMLPPCATCADGCASSRSLLPCRLVMHMPGLLKWLIAAMHSLDTRARGGTC
jgi:hypothetical protein